MTRTLVEDEHGFHVERGKRRNLLNSAGSDVRHGTLGNRTYVKVLRENDNARSARLRRNPNSRAKVAVVSTPVTRSTTRYIRHTVADLVIRSIGLGLDPVNVGKLARLAQDGSARTVAVSLGAGRGW